jgi:hypothetical protein
MTTNTNVDPRGPRYGAAITSILSLIAFYLSLANESLAYAIVVALGVLFTWSLVSPSTHPYGWSFAKFIRPNLAAPKELQDPKPLKFAQQVGLAFALLGIIGGIFSAPLITVSAAFIFIAAFLNTFFGLCLGCQLYLLIRRVGIIR